jgi:hypothetical protein
MPRTLRLLGSDLACLLALAACAATAPPALPPVRPPITEGETITPDAVDAEALAAWIRSRGRPPVDFLVEQFDRYDVVLVGEIHGLRTHTGFVAGALGPLYARAGVRVVCTEFVRASETPRLRAILEAEAWDEAAAIDLMRDGAWPTWGWREYVDVLQAAWRVNAARPDGAPALRIVGIDDDWTQLGMMDASRSESFQMRLKREAVLHESARDAINAHGPRALVHVGAAHAVRHEIRLAERLHTDFGDRLGSVILHHELATRSGPSPIETLIDRAVAEGASEGGPVGFPVVGSPIARVRDDDMVPMKMLGPAAAFEDFVPALIHLGPAATLERGRWIEGFVTAHRFEEAREMALRLGLIEEGEGTTPETLDAALAAKMGGPGS